MRMLLAVSLGLAACSGTPPNAPMCSTSETACGTDCVDLKTSAAHCGACGTACTTGQSCVNSACFADTCSGTTCAATQICSADHCTERACVGVTCAAGQGCIAGSCVSTSCGSAQCPTGEVCVNGTCADPACFGVLCPSGQSCVLGACQATHCSNNTQDSDETDVDCGGSCPTKCRAAQGCTAGTDCASGTCTATKCGQATTCSDTKRDGTETDVDCGGPDCTLRCSVGSGCLTGTDCASGSCPAGVCVGPSCSDAKQNGTETDIDCGGVCTLKCATGQKCAVPADCASMSCTSGICTMASCTDTTQNGTETDVDCGGSCTLKCAVGQHCALPTDCTTMSCSTGVCAGASCFDNAHNGSESDIDCGGSCAKKCANNQHCGIPADCLSMSCVNGSCAGSSCTDLALNGNETDTDCGGSCSPCVAGKHCLGMTDCQSSVCTSAVCQAASCTDTVKNGMEADTDCGGPCPLKCVDGKTCSLPSDCMSGACTGGFCGGQSCVDGMKNGSESDVDCGGICARKCLVGQGCGVPSDCASGVCQGSVCQGDPLVNGLVAWWTMNGADITNTTMVDASGNGHIASFVGGFASAAGKIGGAVQITGANTFINVDDLISPTTALTMSAWVNTMPTGQTQYILNNWCIIGCSDSDQAYQFIITNTGAVQCWINGSSGADRPVTGPIVADGTWHLLTCTVDKNVTGPNQLLYVDGAQVAAATDGADGVHFSLDPLVIGKGVNGTLDDLRIYNRALTSAEVLSLVTTTYPPVPQPATALTAMAVSSAQVDLSWVTSPSAGVTGYRIERSLAGAWFPIAVTAGPPFSDYIVPGGSVLHYRVSAQTATGSSPATSAATVTTPAGPVYSVANGLLAYWTANSADVVGPSEIDATDGGNTATLVGGPVSTAGVIREGFQVSGSSYLSVSSAPSPASAIALTGWFKTTQTSTVNVLNRWCILGCADSDQEFQLQLNRSVGTGVLTFWLNGLNGADYNVTGRMVVNDGQWHFIVVSGDGAGFANNMKIYVDGVLDSDVSVGSNLLHFTGDPIRFGESFSGTMDDLRLYGRALTPSEIHGLYANGNMGAP